MNESTGLMVERKNIDSIVNAITLLQNKERRKEIGEKARERVVSKYSWDIITSHYDMLINE